MNTDDERAASRRRCGPQHAIAFVFVHVAFSLFAQPAFAVEPTGFLAASGPAPANSRGLYWRSAEQPLHDAELQIWDLESDVPTEVGVVRLPVTTGLGAKYEGIVRPTTGWSVGDRYRFVYRSGRSLQKVEVVVDAARVEAGDAAAVVTARVSTPFVRRAGDKCLSHCPDWDTSAGVSAVVVEIDLGPWEPFRSHLIVGVVDADDEARPHARLVDQERILLYRHCGVGRSDLPEAFWLSVTFPAASAQNTSKFGPIEVPDVCGSGPVIDAENWPAPETNVVLSSVATESTESTEAAAPQIQTTAIEHDPPVSQRETAASPANEPETGQVEWTLQVDPLTTLLGFVHLQVERRLGSHASVYLGPSLEALQ